MNREQMIAWLTLEGWEPCVDILGPPLIRQSYHRVWLETTGRVVRDTTATMRNNFIASEVAIPWADISDENIGKLYDFLEAECK